MLNLTGLKSAAQAGAYYDADDYYSEQGQSPSRWLGAGADALGLGGEVDREQFQAMLEGHLPNGQELGRAGKDGELEHMPGWDMTFSAAKSVSIAALVGGDQRLVDAHRAAVTEAINYVQEHAVTRIRQSGEIEREDTNNLAVAAFDHATSRNLDPQMHTHCLILNATQDKEGQWRSLDGREFYQIQHAANEIYQQSLARSVQGMGYEIEQSKSGWELTGVTQAQRELYSGRVAAIDAWLERNGYDRETASAAVRERASLATRPAKERDVDHKKLAEAWREQAQEAGLSLDGINATGGEPTTDDAARADALAAVGRAAKHLGERQSRFTTEDLEKAALREARATSADLAAVRDAIEEKRKERDLIARKIETGDGIKKGFTTKEAAETERKMLKIEQFARGSVAPMLSLDKARSAVKKADEASEHGFNQGQTDAATGILASRDRIQAVQGFAGTAKTTSVLKTVAAQAKDLGYTVKGFAPTRSAADQLAEGAGIEESTTVAEHLQREQGRLNETGREQELWIVDESSLMSAKDTQALLFASERANARVVLVGDVQQLGSVEAGESFRQLQEHGMATHVLDDVVRQQNDQARSAVYSAIEGDAQAAMRSIERSGKITEIQDGQERRDQMAKDYLALSPEDRKQALVIDPTRNGRADLNKKIREGLEKEGVLAGEKTEANTLDSADMTDTEKRDASRYEEGQQVVFGRDIKSKGIEKNEPYTVTGVDYAKQTVKLESKDGQAIDWKPKIALGDAQAFNPTRTEIQAGDKLQVTKNNRETGLANGDQLTVDKVDGNKITATDAKGKSHTLDTEKTEGRYLRHAYATTVHASQGRTTGQVMANLGTEHKELLNQRSFYTAVSRAKHEIKIYTDDKKAVAKDISRKSGQQETALDKIKKQERKELLERTERQSKEREKEKEKEKLSGLKREDPFKKLEKDLEKYVAEKEKQAAKEKQRGRNRDNGMSL